MPTHHDETLLERYQREHREFEGMNMSKAEELANMLDDLYAVDERPIDKETSTELRRLSAINAELLEALKGVTDGFRILKDSDFPALAKARAAIAKAQGEQP